MRSTAWPLAVTIVGLAAWPSGAHADERPLAIGAALGYSFPGGSSERGARTSDVTFGVPALAIDAAWRVIPRFSVGAGLSYGLTTPRLCPSSADCTKSLGHDVAVFALGRFHAGRFGAFVPEADLALGYEWFSSKVSDHGATATRSLRGLLIGVEAHGMFALSERWSLGPVLGLALGSFDHASLDAPGVATHAAVDDRALHAWWHLAVRIAATW